MFPEYKCWYDDDIIKILQNRFGIDSLFSQSCDFSTLSDESLYYANIWHVTDLTINRKGIEGAAVTAIGMPGASGPSEIVTVQKDFIVNKAFGFIITDWQDTTLFSGVVNNV